MLVGVLMLVAIGAPFALVMYICSQVDKVQR